MRTGDSSTRHRILRAALRRFAECGYAAASVQEIVQAARVTKPTLYYYFPSKAKLYAALVDFAHDERFHRMQVAAARGRTAIEKLEHIVAASFTFFRENRDLMRLALASAFAAPGEVPDEARGTEKGKRNYEYVRALIKAGLAAGEFDRRFRAEELTFGLYGQMNIYMMAQVIWPACCPDRRAAGRVMELFLRGAGHAPRVAKRIRGSRKQA